MSVDGGGTEIGIQVDPPKDTEDSPIEFLTQRDQELLYDSGITIAKKIIADYPEELPSAFVLPENTARILAYLLLPLINKISAERHVEKPLLLTFQAQGRDQLAIFRNLTDESGALDPELANIYSPTQQKQIQEDINFAKTLQTSHNARAIDIIDALKFHNRAVSIAIFDDYVTNSPITIPEIQRAFNEKNITTKAYALMGQGNENYFKEYFGIQIGITDPLTIQTGTASHGFDYRISRDALGYKKSAPSDSVYVQPSSQKNIDKMRILRKDMRKIGEKIVQNIAA